MEDELITKKSWWRKSFSFVWEVIKVVVISLAIIIPVRYFLIQPFYVKGASMEPNFYDHEYLIINEIGYRLGNIERGDVVVFRYPKDPQQFFIKRVIGLPGEKVAIHEGKVWITNKEHPQEVALEEDYLPPDLKTAHEDYWQVGDNEYFVLGDNRNSSSDSRVFGVVPRANIVGQAWIRGWPLDRITFNFPEPKYNI